MTLLHSAEAWWNERTGRERHMLMAMMGLIATIIVWAAVVRPVLGWRADAANRAAAAAVTLSEVRAAVASLGPAGPAPTPPADGLEPVIRRTAGAADLEVVMMMSASGQLGFQLSSVRSGPLFAWLGSLESGHDLTICSLGVTENADATLNVEGAVAVGGCTG